MLEHVKCGFLVNHAVALITAGQVKTRFGTGLATFSWRTLRDLQRSVVKNLAVDVSRCQKTGLFFRPKHHRRSGPALKRRAKALLISESGRCHMREEFGGLRQQVTRFFAVGAFFLKLAMQETGRQVQGGGQALRRSGR